MDLQYLPEDKKREEDPDIRKMLLETLFLVPHAHTTNTLGLMFSCGSPYCLFPCVADSYQIWSTDVKGQECLSNHERVPQMGERRSCESSL